MILAIIIDKEVSTMDAHNDVGVKMLTHFTCTLLGLSIDFVEKMDVCFSFESNKNLEIYCYQRDAAQIADALQRNKDKLLAVFNVERIIVFVQEDVLFDVDALQLDEEQSNKGHKNMQATSPVEIESVTIAGVEFVPRRSDSSSNNTEIQVWIS